MTGHLFREWKGALFERDDFMWTDLKGWDVAGADNEERAGLFQRDEYGKGEICLPYRFFQGRPADSDSGNMNKKLPLVVFLHGADAIGNDNESQLLLHDVGTVFADRAWQEKHPCHIVAPQYDRGMHWANLEMREVLQSFVEYAADFLKADRQRIYIYGYSAGAIGIFSLLKKYTAYYAAAVPVCGSSSGEELEKLARTPLWMFHAADDPIVSAGKLKMSFGRLEHLGSHALAERLKNLEGAQVHYTEYKEGEMMEKYGLHPHCAWVLMGRNEKVKEWMFSKRLYF